VRSSVADGLVDRHGPDVEATGTWLRGAAVRCIRVLLLVIVLHRCGRLISDELDVRRRRLRSSVPRRRCGQVLELPLLLAPAEGTTSRCRHITLPHGPSLGAGVTATVVFRSWCRDSRALRSDGPPGDQGFVYQNVTKHTRASGVVGVTAIVRLVATQGHCPWRGPVSSWEWSAEPGPLLSPSASGGGLDERGRRHLPRSLSPVDGSEVVAGRLRWVGTAVIG
jgi:hypothetical protein